MSALVLAIIKCAPAGAAVVEPGQLITPDNASLVATLVSPGNFILVRQGMRMKIGATGRIEFPAPYQDATEKYSAQVTLNQKGELEHYVAGLPFPLIDPNDPHVATKVMWNLSFGPELADSIHVNNVEVTGTRPGGGWLFGGLIFDDTTDLTFYNAIGRTEVDPIPADPARRGIRSIFSVGCCITRIRYTDPNVADDADIFGYGRVGATVLSDSAKGNIDADSYFGFAAKIEDFNYRLLGIAPMLASVHAENSPAKACQFDNSDHPCPENWEIRTLYVIEATEKPRPWHKLIGSAGVSIPKRILYVDSEGWFVTASDQYDRSGTLWKTLAIFTGYRDRSMPEAQVAIYPFKRLFQTAMIDEDIDDTMRFTSILYLPGTEVEEHEGWYIDAGAVIHSSAYAAAAKLINKYPGNTR
jgi:Protein of unknown function (DUF1329)